MQHNTNIYEIYRNLEPEKGHKKTLEFLLDVMTMGFSATWDKDQRKEQIEILDRKIRRWFDMDGSNMFIKPKK